MVRAIVRSLDELLNQPAKILVVCACLAAASLVFDGSALHLWSLRRDQHTLESRISETRAKSRQLEFRIHEAQRPEFIERQARDQFDLVKEGDLVFVFSDDPGPSPAEP